MKKFMFAITTILMMLVVITSCSTNRKDPKAVAKAICEKMKDNDYKGAMEYTDGTESQKALYAAMIEEKLNKNEENKKIIESYEIGDAQIDEEKGIAIVQTKTVYSDGEVDESPMKLKRNENGEWYMELKMK